MQIFGRSVKSKKDAIMYHGFPASDEITILPAGRPSPEINSYLPSGYFELKGGPIGVDRNVYLMDSDSVEIVDHGSPDDSSYYGRLSGAVYSFFENTKNEVEDQQTFLSKGFKQSVDDLKYNAFDLGSYLYQVLIVVLIIAVLWFLSKLIP